MQKNKNKELGGAFLRGTVNLCFEDLQHRTLTANRYFCKDPRKFACVGTFGGKWACLILKTWKNGKFDIYWLTLVDRERGGSRPLTSSQREQILELGSRQAIYRRWKNVCQKWASRWKSCEFFIIGASLLDTSCGEYATPVIKLSSGGNHMKDSVSSSKFSGSETSLDQNSDYVFLQVRYSSP